MGIGNLKTGWISFCGNMIVLAAGSNSENIKIKQVTGSFFGENPRYLITIKEIIP